MYNSFFFFHLKLVHERDRLVPDVGIRDLPEELFCRPRRQHPRRAALNLVGREALVVAVVVLGKNGQDVRGRNVPVIGLLNYSVFTEFHVDITAVLHNEFSSHKFSLYSFKN
jgi:hypothetical protein